MQYIEKEKNTAPRMDVRRDHRGGGVNIYFTGQIFAQDIAVAKTQKLNILCKLSNYGPDMASPYSTWKVPRADNLENQMHIFSI